MLSLLRYPATLGDWLPTRQGMECRLPFTTVQVDAPKAFLLALQRLCNGARSLSDIRATLSETWSPQDVDLCLERLIAGGALVEASYLSSHEAKRGWLPRRLPRLRSSPEALDEYRLLAQGARSVVPARKVNRPSDSPLVALLSRRRSVRTFSDKALSQPVVEKILWAVAGMASVSDGKIHRTTPSPGSTYQIRWFAAMLRPAGDIARGVYRIICHDSDQLDAGLGFEAIDVDVERVWETFLIPTCLEYAHFVLYPVVDTTFIAEKYGNRSVMFAQLEAGHSLQNGALAALEGGADSIVRGDTVEPVVLDVLGVSDSLMPLPALVVGSSPSDREILREQAAYQAVPLQLVPDHVLASPSRSHLSIAGPLPLAIEPLPVEWSLGKSPNAQTACIKAEAEAWERIGWAIPGELCYERMADMPEAVDPMRLVAYADHQYQNGFPFEPFSPDHEHAWLQGVNLQSGNAASLLAQCALAHSGLPEQARRHLYTNSSTSGMAAGTTKEMALSRAVIELLERDAFVRTWVSGVPPAQLAEASLAGHCLERVRALREAGYQVTLLHLPCNYLPVVAVFVQKGDEHFTSVTTAAALDYEDALASALSEAEVRIYAWRGRLQPDPIAWNQVLTAADHGRYFQTRRGATRANWLCTSGEVSSLKFLNTPRSHDELFGRLWSAGHAIWACDMTPEGAALKQGRQPLHVWRAFVSNMLPLWFGHYATPWGSLLQQGFRPSRRSVRAISLHPCT